MFMCLPAWEQAKQTSFPLHQVAVSRYPRNNITCAGPCSFFLLPDQAFLPLSSGRPSWLLQLFSLEKNCLPSTPTVEADLPDDSSSSQYDLTIIATKLINFFFIPTLHLVLLQSSSLKDRHLQLRFLLLWNRNMPTDRLTTLHNQRFTKKPMPLFQRTFF